jgi:hypothetical protein
MRSAGIKKEGLVALQKPQWFMSVSTPEQNIQTRLASFRESIVNKEKAGLLTCNIYIILPGNSILND